MKNKLDTTEYKKFFFDIKERIYKAQYEALKAVNKELINLYWDIGEMIVQRQKTSGWGKSIVETLSHDLQNEFPGINDLSARNLWYMRNFYSLYSENQICNHWLQKLVGQKIWLFWIDVKLILKWLLNLTFKKYFLCRNLWKMF